ncbi:unnamed protein product [marine sediment metagenome]|uniref:Uncharacterized protein n=1 Tax=marine sediment metagenome TaxID=412755 RepID=X1T4M3_9ZZZZ
MSERDDLLQKYASNLPDDRYRNHYVSYASNFLESAAALEELEGLYREWDATFWEEIRKDVEPKGIKWYDLSPNEADRWRELLSEASVSWVLEMSPEVGKALFEIVEKVTGRKVM